MYFTIWVLMITVYDCFVFESLMHSDVKKIKWNGLLKRKEKKANDKKKKKTMFLDLKRKKKERKRIKINRPFQMVIHPSSQLSQKEL